jgi:hypothetical protein
MNCVRMARRTASVLILWLGVTTGAMAAKAPPARDTGKSEAIFTDSLSRGGFMLVGAGQTPTIVIDPADAAVVRHAADDLAADIQTVTSQQPIVSTQPGGKIAILVGTLGKSKLIDQIVAAKRRRLAPVRQLGKLRDRLARHPSSRCRKGFGGDRQRSTRHGLRRL